jgi:hypothetical protein
VKITHAKEREREKTRLRNDGKKTRQRIKRRRTIQKKKGKKKWRKRWCVSFIGELLNNKKAN